MVQDLDRIRDDAARNRDERVRAANEIFLQNERTIEGIALSHVDAWVAVLADLTKRKLVHLSFKCDPKDGLLGRRYPWREALTGARRRDIDGILNPVMEQLTFERSPHFLRLKATSPVELYSRHVSSALAKPFVVRWHSPWSASVEIVEAWLDQ